MERIFAVGLDYLARCSYFPDITENAVHSSPEISGNSIHYISSNGKCPLCQKNAQKSVNNSLTAIGLSDRKWTKHDVTTVGVRRSD